MLVHLRMQDAYSGAFWFDAEVRGTATLTDVDSYLRAIWLECCGHMSRFSLEGWGSRESGQPTVLTRRDTPAEALVMPD